MPGFGWASAAASALASSVETSRANEAASGRSSPGRRHHAGLKLPNHPFGQLGVVANLRDVEMLERNVAALELVVVAIAAIGINDVVQIRHGRHRGMRGLLRLRPSTNARGGLSFIEGRGHQIRRATRLPRTARLRLSRENPCALFVVPLAIHPAKEAAQDPETGSSTSRSGITTPTSKRSWEIYTRIGRSRRLYAASGSPVSVPREA